MTSQKSGGDEAGLFWLTHNSDARTADVKIPDLRPQELNISYLPVRLKLPVQVFGFLSEKWASGSWAEVFWWKWDGGDVSIYKKCQGFGSEIFEVKSCQIRGDWVISSFYSRSLLETIVRRFYPDSLGKWSNLTSKHVFQMGLLNHQLLQLLIWFEIFAYINNDNHNTGFF